MKIGETVIFWRDCPDCGGRGTLVINSMVPDASMVFHPNNLRQCPRCLREATKFNCDACDGTGCAACCGLPGEEAEVAAVNG